MDSNSTLNRLEDTPVPSYDCENRANRTLPPGMVVRQSGIPGAGLGVWAEKYFPAGIHFGPYGGDIYHYHMHHSNIGSYTWKVSNEHTQCQKLRDFSKIFIIIESQ